MYAQLASQMPFRAVWLTQYQHLTNQFQWRLRRCHYWREVSLTDSRTRLLKKERWVLVRVWRDGSVAGGL